MGDMNLLTWLEAMLEKYFGQKPAKFITLALLAVGTIALFLFFIGIILENGGRQFYEWSKSIIVNISLPGLPASPSVDAMVAAIVVMVVALIFFGIVFVGILYFFGKGLFKKAVPQLAIDGLAELRNEGIDTVYAVKVSNQQEFDNWKCIKQAWEEKLRTYIKNNFPKADYLYASHLGVVPLQNFMNAYSDEHLREVCFVIRQMDIVEQILNSYRR